MTTKDIHSDLVETLGDSSPPYSTVARWAKEFKLGRTSTEDEHREGRPSTSLNEENVKKVEEVVLADRRVTIRHGWKKERIVAEYPDGKIIMVLPDDPKYALKKVEEIREMVDNDLGFQQVPLRLHSRTKTLLFISSDKKVVGCLIAEHIQWGYRVIEDNITSENCDKDRIISERVKAWCCSTTPEPAICGVSRIWVFSMMRRKKIASRMLECLR
ncbi:unnamed protein product [Ranitomeya imitator]|uniref:N-acetyltransferase ESCO acetyl-transferase domain-containing protein n=1 Tax=Ranitomeya imitator TaxID=111125 RepID=A0ABN9L1F5_9NEOB|nr:unnamed protein product [Ranitomeya imitator]